MKRLLAIASLMLSVGAVTFAQGTVEKAVMDLERQWVKAALASDAAALGLLLSADFVSVQADGTMQAKAEWRHRFRRSSAGGDLAIHPG